MLGGVLAPGMKDVDGVLDVQAFSSAEEADQLLFHLLLGQQIFFFFFSVWDVGLSSG